MHNLGIPFGVELKPPLKRKADLLRWTAPRPRGHKRVVERRLEPQEAFELKVQSADTSGYLTFLELLVQVL